MYKFDGDLLVVQKIGSLEDDAKRALANLLADAIVHADDVGGRGRGHGGGGTSCEGSFDVARHNSQDGLRREFECVQRQKTGKESPVLDQWRRTG